ncbi:beta strand repeat-containing protein, partial [Azospirillum palustre]|uniref:beta strand repeat-containing protein n=1 Tax=Azospirillum palustre TaxID=2044885 RepID=UPI00137B1698
LTVKTLKTGGAAITLGNAGNDVTTLDLRARNAADTTNADGAISYTDATGLDSATLATSGTATLTVHGSLGTLSGTLGTLTATVDGALGFGAIAVASTLTATAGDVVTQSGAINANALSAKTQKSGGAAITLTNSGNDVVNLDLQTLDTQGGRAAGAIAYTDASAVNIAALQTGSNATVVAGGGITQSAALQVSGTSSFTSQGGGIVLTDGGNTLGGQIALNTTGANDATLANALDTSLTGTVGRDLAVTAGGRLTFATVTAGGTLSATASDAVTQSGAVTANRLNVTTRNDGGAAITLTDAGNNVAVAQLTSRNSGDTANASAAIAYTDVNGVEIAGVGTTGTATIDAGGAISQSGAILANTLVARTRGGSEGGIRLTNVGNDVSSLDLRSLDGNGNMAAGDIAYTDATAMDIAGLSTAGSVALVAGGPVTQSGALTAGSLSVRTLKDGGAAITLTNSGNDAGSIDLRTLNADGTANAAGAITYSDVNGLTTATVGTASAATLAARGSIGTLAGTAAALGVTTDGAFNIGTITVGGTLTVTAGGAVTQSGAITANTVAVTTRKDGGAAITLDNSANNAAAIDLRARNADDTADAAGAIVYTDTDGVTIQRLRTGGSLVLNAGSVDQSGAIAVGGPARITSRDLRLTNADNGFAGDVVLTTAGDAVLVNGRETNLTASVAGDLTVQSKGVLTVAPRAVAGGSVTLTAASGTVLTGDLTAGSGSVTIATPLRTASSLGITAKGNVSLGTVTQGEGSTLTINAGGAIDAAALSAGTGTSLALRAGGTVSFTNAVTGLSTLNLLDAQTFTFGGAVNADTLVTYDRPYTINLMGGGTIGSATRFVNTGTLRLNGTLNDMVFAGGLDTGSGSPSTTYLSGTISTMGGAMKLGRVGTSLSDTRYTVLEGATVLKSGALSIGPLNASRKGVDLTIQAGASDIVFNGEVGQTQPLNNVRINGSSSVLVSQMFTTTGVLTLSVEGTFANTNLMNLRDQASAPYEGLGLDVGGINILKATKVTAYGKVAGYGGKQASLQAQSNTQSADYVFNGCPIKQISGCTPLSIGLPVQALRLTLDDARVVVPVRPPSQSDADAIFSNSGNEELW